MKYILSALRRAVGLQFVYCMGIFPARWHLLGFRWSMKVGISDSPMQRRRDVQEALRQHTGQRLHVYCLPMPVFAPKQCETAVHTVLCKLSHNPFPGTTGHTEWFRAINLLSGFLVFLYAFAEGMPFGAAIGWWALVAAIPVPFDGFLLVALTAAVQWAVFLAAFWGVAQIFTLCGISGLM